MFLFFFVAILYGDLATALPFEHTIDIFELRGDHLIEVFEHAVEGEWSSDKYDPLYLTQVAGTYQINLLPLRKINVFDFHFHVATGVKVVYDVTKEALDRVVSVDVIVVKDNIPRYEPLDPNKYYRCISNSFMVQGGDEFHMIPKYMQNHKYKHW